MHHVYNYSARYLLGLAGFAGLCFAYGVWQQGHQVEAFKAAELLMYTAGLFSILLVRRQLWHQDEQTKKLQQQAERDHQWRTYASLHEHFTSVPTEEMRKAAYAKAEELNFVHLFVNRGTEMSDDIKNLILADTVTWGLFRSYLDQFEEFSAAVIAGLVDDGYAFSVQGTRIVRNFTVFRPLIAHYQAGSPSAYCELSKLAMRWRLQMSVKEHDSVPMIGIGTEGAPKINRP